MKVISHGLNIKDNRFEGGLHGLTKNLLNE